MGNLRAENEELRERVRQLEQLLSEPLPILWNLPLTLMKGRMLGILYRTPGLVPRERLEAAIHGIESDVDPKGIDVHLCQLRHRLKPFGIAIETVRGRGYRLTTESRATLHRLIEHQAHVAATAVKPINGANQGEVHAVDH